MPRIFDNIELELLPSLRESLSAGTRADICVGYFNLRGWKHLASEVDSIGGSSEDCVRIMVGMQSAPKDLLREALSLNSEGVVDQQKVVRLKKQIAEEFREQLTFGIPTADDEAALQTLRRQILEKKVTIKLFLRHQLHAKLYLVHRNDHNNPTIGFVGSSNLTLSGLSFQGELNVDVLDSTACEKLQSWFDKLWGDRWCLDISAELAEILDQSWASERLVPPYHIYLKMAYHLSHEARAGLATFRIPRDFQEILFPYQSAAVQIAAHHVKNRGGVLLGDVVGLGKTMMATALAKLIEEDTGQSTVIICPKNLKSMWANYSDKYGLRAKVVSITSVNKELRNIPARFRTVLIDESHNLRNREGKRYQAIHQFIRESGSRCILLSATPYNKSFLDLSAQLRLFVAEDKDVGLRPERLLREIGEVEFNSKHQCSVRSLQAFEKSGYSDDWRELMRLFLVRRTRTFIQKNYSQMDQGNGRRYLDYPNGDRFYFPARIPRTVTYDVNDSDPNDPYGRLASPLIEDIVKSLKLPRYGLGKYVADDANRNASGEERKQLDGLSRAGTRLMGFCRTNLFKRLESGGVAFLLSIERHILRNSIFLYAIDNDLPLPIGSQSADFLDTSRSDSDDEEAALFDSTDADLFADNEFAIGLMEEFDFTTFKNSPLEFFKRAAEVYVTYQTKLKRRFKWIRPKLFSPDLRDALQEDVVGLCRILEISGDWDVNRDEKFLRLLELVKSKHPREKVLVFTQFADTAKFLFRELTKRGVESLDVATGGSADPTELAWRFSPKSNEKLAFSKSSREIRVLVATDILSEGQNLQDAHIIVNYDLPWAIIRLIQRAGRVDRIGQNSEQIFCYSFLPSDRIEQIIGLRRRVLQRLQENAEVVGTDEAFFDDENYAEVLTDIYHEKAGILDDERDAEVDLASQALQIWKNAIAQNPKLENVIRDLSDVSFSTRHHDANVNSPPGVLVYVRTAEGTDALAWIDENGRSVTQSQQTILQMAQCHPNTPALARDPRHHELVRQGVKMIVDEERMVGGQLGRPSGARYRIYHRLKDYIGETRGTLFEALPESKELQRAIDDVYRFPLRQSAVDLLNKKLRESIGNHELAELVLALRDQDQLTQREDQVENHEPKIICSMGLFEGK